MKKGLEYEWKRSIVQKLSSSLVANIVDLPSMLYYTVSVDYIKSIKITNQYDDMVDLAKSGKVTCEFKKLISEIADICECDSEMNRRARFLYNLKVLYNEYGEYMPKCIMDWRTLAKYLLICAVKLDESDKDYKNVKLLTAYFTLLFKIRYSKDSVEILKQCTLCGVTESLPLATELLNEFNELSDNVLFGGGYAYE